VRWPRRDGRRPRRTGRLDRAESGRVAPAAGHPEVTGEALDQAAALRLGREIFGPLLADAPQEVAR